MFVYLSFAYFSAFSIIRSDCKNDSTFVENLSDSFIYLERDHEGTLKSCYQYTQPDAECFMLTAFNKINLIGSQFLRRSLLITKKFIAHRKEK